MDIFTKLLGGSTRKATTAPQQRLIQFKKAHDNLQLIWRRQNTEANQVTSAEPLQACLQEIRRILQNEVQTPAPHLCARHVASFHMYSTMAQLAAIHPEDHVIRETLAIFKTLLDTEEGEFVKDKAFADAVVGFISTVSVGALPTDIEAEAVEVLYYISAKLRLEPDLLSTWFRPSKKGYALPSESKQVNREREEFLLFYMILDFVHYDGRTGDFARTGLQYLIECGAHSALLEQWIIESDLASLMASGLGALYSQLSRKLVINHDPDHLPAVVAFSQESRPKTPPDADDSSSPEFKDHLRTFLSYLAFWQDVLEHCSSTDVKQSLLDHFKFLFLHQLLYPSLVESSDRDGGSLVAVLTYLRCIIESIDHPDLVRLVFEYLLAVPEPKAEEKTPVRPTALARRRRSQSLLASLSRGQAQPVPDLFNLEDLAIGSLRSPNQQTVVATLRLVSTMLRSHHQYDITFLKVGRQRNNQALRSLHSHERNTEAFYSIIESLMEEPRLTDLYDVHLEDAQNLLEAHPCSLQLFSFPVTSSYVSDTADTKPNNAQDMSQDLIFNALIALLEDFFVNEVETNISLTHVLATTILCAKRCLDGWFLDSEAQPESIENDNLDLRGDDADSTKEAVTLEDKARLATDNAEHSASHARAPATPIFAALNSLVAQVEAFRKKIENFDIYLTERRHIFKVGDESERAAGNSLPSDRKPEKSEASTRLPVRHSPRVSSGSERLPAGNPTAARSRSHSPRGRNVEVPPAHHIVDRLSQLRQSPSSSPALSATRAVSRSPLRKDLASTDSPVKQPGTPMGPPDALSQRLRIKVKRVGEANMSDLKSDTSSVRSDAAAVSDATKEVYEEVTLSHVLTSVIILQEFVLELVAIVQVRASLFGEVKFD